MPQSVTQFRSSRPSSIFTILIQWEIFDILSHDASICLNACEHRAHGTFLKFWDFYLVVDEPGMSSPQGIKRSVNVDYTTDAPPIKQPCTETSSTIKNTTFRTETSSTIQNTTFHNENNTDDDVCVKQEPNDPITIELDNDDEDDDNNDSIDDIENEGNEFNENERTMQDASAVQSQPGSSSSRKRGEDGSHGYDKETEKGEKNFSFLYQGVYALMR